jgi:hypothetical protein
MPPEQTLVRSAWRPSWVKAALLAWAAVMLFVCVKAMVAPRSHSVYPIFTSAGKRWQKGRSLYKEWEPGLDFFRYSPLAASLFAPVSSLPESVTGALWRLLSGGILGLGILLWLRELLPGRLTRSHLAIVFLLVLPLALPNLYNGQVNSLMLGLVLTAVALVRRQHFLLAAGCVALTFWLKLYPLAPGLLLALLYPRRFAPAFFLLLGAGFALPFAFQEPGFVWTQYTDWLSYLRADDRVVLDIYVWPRDIRLLLRACGVRLPEGIYPVVQLGTGAVFAAICLLARRRNRSEREVLLLLTHLSCCWMTTFGPATESLTWMLLAPSLAAALLVSWIDRQPRWARALPLLSLGLLLLTLTVKWLPGMGRPVDWGTQPLAGLVFVLWAVLTGLGFFSNRTGQGRVPNAAQLRTAA